MSNYYYLMRVTTFLLMLMLVSCQKQRIVDYRTDHSSGFQTAHPILQFSFTDDQLDWTFESLDTTYGISDPIPKLIYEDNFVEVKNIKVRGNFSANVRRKSFGVDTYEYVSFDGSQYENNFKSKYFRLLAMPEDLCYIENRLGFGLLRKAEVYPLNFNYVEVVLNDETNGVYLLIENPNDFCLRVMNHGAIIRRGYFGKIDSYQYQENIDGHKEQEYLDAFESIYEIIKDYHGVPLLGKLNEVLDVRQYMQMMAYHYLIQNGDYTDEAYFYDISGDEKIRFSVMPWDLDDLFSSEPHELQNTYFTGNTFGNRIYHSKEDVVADIGDKLIFSIEDDIDYIIAKDPFLYQVYLQEMGKLLALITELEIENEFSDIENELSSFFEDEKIVEQSKYDIDSCDPELLLHELQEKKTQLINRRSRILELL